MKRTAALLATLLLPTIVLGDSFAVIGTFESETRATALLGEMKRNFDLPGRLLAHEQQHLSRVALGPFDDERKSEISKILQIAELEHWWLTMERNEVSQHLKNQSTQLATDDGELLIEEYRVLVDDRSEDRAGNDKTVSDTDMSIVEAVLMLLDNNLGLQAQNLESNIQNAQTKKARAGLLPHIAIDLLQTAIDQDRANASNGRAPEYRGSVNVGLSQILFSDSANAQLAIQKILETATILQVRDWVLATALLAIESYVGLMKAESLIVVLESDLQVTHENRERSNIRLQLGVANLSEVLRWDTRIANNRIQVTEAKTKRDLAIVRLNQLLNREPMTPIKISALAYEHPSILLFQPEIRKRYSEFTTSKAFTRFWVDEALTHAPVLQIASQELLAQRRSLIAARRTTKIPVISLNFNTTRYMSEGGAGVDELDFTFPGSETRFGGETDDTEWSGSIKAELPLFSGGANRATVKQELARLDQAQLNYDDSLVQLRANLNSNIIKMHAKWQAFQYAKEASVASKENLSLIGESYEKGVITILDLLDAQAVSLKSEVDANNFLYDFMVEYFRLQRIVGYFDVLQTEEQRRQTLKKIVNTAGN